MMKNSMALFKEIAARVLPGEDREEVQAIVYVLLDHFLGLSKTAVLSAQPINYSEAVAARLEEAVERINKHEPVQYVLGEEFFLGRKFQVNHHVLIPRPETEELVRMVVKHIRERTDSKPPLRIVDIGTGSGCIAITLRLEIPDAVVYGTDISKAALSVAATNAAALGARVSLLEHNVLTEGLPLSDVDVIVSNPPYVTLAEAPAMQPAVTAFEPHVALFVPDEDPLMFYRAIAKKARHSLTAGGLLAFEVNERFASDVAALLNSEGFADVRTVRDISGKERIATGIKPR